MQTPSQILADLWSLAGGDPAALDSVKLAGSEQVLPSSFRVDAAAQASIAASGLAAAEIWKARSGQSQRVAVDMVHAAAERGWIDGAAVMREHLLAIKRAGADFVLTYHARAFAESQ